MFATAANIFRLSAALTLVLGLAAAAAPKKEAPKKEATAAKAAAFLRLDYYVWNRWEKQGGPDKHKERLQNLDVAVFFSPLVPDAQGHLAAGDDFVRALENLKKAKAEKTRIWLGVGSLSAVVKDAQSLETFVRELTGLCEKHGFTGVDIDWEDAAVKPEDYARVVRRVAEECHRRKWTVSNSHATAPHYVKKSAAAAAFLDYINIQFYYSMGNGMPLDELKKRLARFEKAGVPRSKILIGLPVYAMVDMGKNRDAKPTTIGYAGLLDKGASPEENSWTNPANGVTYHYSGTPLIRAKLEYAKHQGYAGVFSWEMTLDAPYASPNSVLRILDEGTKK